MDLEFSARRKLLWYMVLFMPFMTVANFLLPEAVDLLIKLLRMAISMVFIGYYYKRHLMTGADFLFFGFQGTILLSTLMHSGNIKLEIYRAVAVVGFIAMFKVNLKENPRLFLKAVSIYGVGLSILTAITMFIYYVPGEFKGGMRPDVGLPLEYGRKVQGNHYLMGVDNASFFYIFTCLAIFCVYELVYKRKLSKLFYGTYLFITAAFIYVGAATATFCFVLGVLVILIVSHKDFFVKHFSFLNYRLGLVIVLAFFVMIVWLRRQDIFEFLIVGVFGKSMTLTRRTQIWDFAIVEIFKRPVLGVGLQSDAYNYALFKVNHVHNIIMELIYEGGIIALAFFIAGAVGYCRGLVHAKKRKLVFLLSGAVVIFLINACLDFYPHNYLPYSLFILCESIELLVCEFNDFHATLEIA